MQLYEVYGRQTCFAQEGPHSRLYPISKHLLIDTKTRMIEWLNPTERLWFNFGVDKYNMDAGNLELCDVLHELGQIGAHHAGV